MRGHFTLLSPGVVLAQSANIDKQKLNAFLLRQTLNSTCSKTVNNSITCGAILVLAHM